MKKIVFATNNKHKLIEITDILKDTYTIVSLNEIGFFEEIPETQPTIEGNALQKAQFINDRFSINCFADDTGLIVDCLNGAPGVYSARYAGKNARYQQNVEKLLFEMKGKKNRNARFKTVICLIFNGKNYFFEGIVEGTITEQQFGTNGFGYDPVFVPNGFDITYAQMNSEQKNSLSHRAIAVNKLAQYLLKNQYE